MLEGQETWRWSRPAFRAEAEEWIRSHVANLAGPIEQPHLRPWGTVFTVPTDDGLLWFKASICSLAYEVPLLRLLGAHRPDFVPRVVAADSERGWMLMENSGTQANELYDDSPPPEVWVNALREYALLQRDVAPHVEELVACGVPDRRSHVVDAFFDAVEGAAVADDERGRLHALEPRLRGAAEHVASVGVPDSIHHDDLHAWNICVGAGGCRVIDWGDSSVANPLFSLGVPLAHGAPREPAGDAYLEPWTAFATRRELDAAVPDALLLARLTGVLKWAVLYSGLPEDERGGYDDVIELRLRGLLELACA